MRRPPELLRLILQADKFRSKYGCFRFNAASGGCWRDDLGYRALGGYMALFTELCGDRVRVCLRGDALRGLETDKDFADWRYGVFAEYLFYGTLHGSAQFI